ncbi:MAG: hypothetical protein H6Q90_6590 [Deltaproteobacteria bacterium]|nr:hypothetical protein [Deltaproteobacteria bacterium]
MLSHVSRRYDDAFLDPFRQRGDELADAALLELRGAGDLVTRLERGAGAGAVACRRLLDHVREVPSWVDFARMQSGHVRARQFALHAGLALLVGSLAESYASASGAKVLVRSGRLDRDTPRRVYETAVFVHSIGMPGGPRPGTPAHRRIVQTRLIHAAIRHGMQKRSDWNPAWGLPVNQEDYASTLLMLSLVFVRSLRRLGVPFSTAEADAVHHGWRYVGWVMGVDEALLSRDLEDETALYQAITRRQFEPDDDSRTLVAALLDTMSGRSPIYLPRGVLAAAARRVLGDRLADALAIAPPRGWQSILTPLSIAGRLAGPLFAAVPAAGRAAESLGAYIAEQSLRGFEVTGSHS